MGRDCRTERAADHARNDVPYPSSIKETCRLHFESRSLFSISRERAFSQRFFEDDVRAAYTAREDGERQFEVEKQIMCVIIKSKSILTTAIFFHERTERRTL